MKINKDEKKKQIKRKKGELNRQIQSQKSFECFQYPESHSDDLPQWRSFGGQYFTLKSVHGNRCKQYSQT